MCMCSISPNLGILSLYLLSQNHWELSNHCNTSSGSRGIRGCKGTGYYVSTKVSSILLIVIFAFMFTQSANYMHSLHKSVHHKRGVHKPITPRVIIVFCGVYTTREWSKYRGQSKCVCSCPFTPMYLVISEFGLLGKLAWTVGGRNRHGLKKWGRGQAKFGRSPLSNFLYPPLITANLQLWICIAQYLDSEIAPRNMDILHVFHPYTDWCFYSVLYIRYLAHVNKYMYSKYQASFLSVFGGLGLRLTTMRSP